MGLAYYNKNNFNQALEFYNRALNIYEKDDNHRESINCAKTLQNIGNIFKG